MAKFNSKKVDMSSGDIKKVVEAVETLDILNQKYGQPHGENPMGITYAAYLSAMEPTSRRRA